jgi:hypothetical protein
MVSVCMSRCVCLCVSFLSTPFFDIQMGTLVNIFRSHPSVVYYINQVFLVSVFLKKVVVGVSGVRLPRVSIKVDMLI